MLVDTSRQDGTFSVTNARIGFSKTYKTESAGTE
jgi:hypothetical protein